METTGSRREVVITVIPDDTRSKRTVDLHFAARTEIYAHVASCLHEAAALPDDGQPSLMLITDAAVPEMKPTYTRIDHHDECSTLTHGALVTRTARLSMAGLREVLLCAWIACPLAVEVALGDLTSDDLVAEAEDPYCGKRYRLPSGETDWCAEPARHTGKCGDQPRNTFIDSEAWTCAGCGAQCIAGKPANLLCRDCAAAPLGASTVVDDGEPLPDCAGCGCSEVGHARDDAQPIATGGCRHRSSCGCTAYTLPQEAAQDEPDEAPARVGVPERMPVPASHYCDSGNCEVCGDGTGDGYVEPDEAAVLAAGELAADEVLDARDRERRSDSAVGPLAEEEPDDEDEGPCMMVGCGHELDDHSLDLERGDRLYCRRCTCRRYLSAFAMRANAAALEPEGAR